MNSRFRFLLIFIILIIKGQGSYSQSTQNPFDIKNRTPKELISSDSADSIFLQPQTTVLPETVEAISESNPFDVSHVPIQKEPLRKKAKKQSSSEKKSVASKKPSSIWDFKFWVLLLSFLLFAVNFTLNRVKMTSLQRALLNQNFQKSLARENNNGNNFFFLLLYILFFLNLALLFYNYIEYNVSIVDLNFKIFLYICLIVTGVYIGKHLFLTLFGFIFPVHKETSIYSFTVKLFNVIVGLILLIINILIVLGPENWRYYLLCSGFLFLSLLFVFRLFNGTIHSSRIASKHTFHFFLYLCATEIAPLVIFYKLLY